MSDKVTAEFLYSFFTYLIQKEIPSLAASQPKQEKGVIRFWITPFRLIRILKMTTSSQAPFLELAQEQQPEPVPVSFPLASRNQQRKMTRREAVLEPMQRFSSSSVSPPLFFISF
jgi:hypothetical protein